MRMRTSDLLVEEQIDAKSGPLSFAQERLWFIDRLEPDSQAYNEPLILHFTGDLRVDALRRSLDEIVRRHDILRTRYAIDADGRPKQIVMPARRVPMPVVDLDAVPEALQEAHYQQLIALQVRRPFALDTGPVMRTLLIRLAPQTHLLVLVVHHIAGDEWSVAVFTRELAALYEAFRAHRPSPLAELPIQYLDVARAERQALNDEALQQVAQQWAQRLSDVSPLEFPRDRPRTAARTNEVAWGVRVLDAEVTRALKGLSRRLKTTVSNTLLSTFEILLSRYTGQQRFVVGIAMMNRDAAAVQGLIGFFVNTIVLRADLSGHPSFETVLARTSRQVFEGYVHQRLPFEKIVAALQPTRSLEHNPLFEIVWSFHHAGEPAPALAGLATRTLRGPARSVTASDLECQIYVIDDQIRLNVGYRTELFQQATIDRLLASWETVIEAIVKDPSQPIAHLPLLSATQRSQVLVDFNRTDQPGADQWHVVRMLRSQVAERPDAIAVSHEAEHLTYRALHRKTTRLAAHLHTRGVGPDVPVAVCLHRGLDMLIAVLGVLEANGAFVPLDASYPTERLAFMLEDARAPVLLTEQALSHQLPADWAQVICLPDDYDSMTPDATAPPLLARPQHLAYVIYTSGSTGRPKGVGVTHRGVANLAMSQAAMFPVRPGARALQVASFSFDAAVWELLVSIAVGRTLVLVDRETVLSGAALADVLRREQVELALLPPSLLATLPDQDLVALQMLVTGAESCPSELAVRWAADRRLVNAYGPTESTVIATMADIAGEGVPPIGRPIANTRVFVLDAAGEPAPIGVPGELHLGGMGLARGYVNRPALTAERFVPDAWSGEPGGRLYRTGDRARWRADGRLEYLGRLDRQVKVRGHRIELEEIEAVLGAQPGVSQAVTTVHVTPRGDPQLVAYVVPARDVELQGSALRVALQRQLPDYMVPAIVRVLSALPVTPNGKINRQALPPPELERPESADAAPQTLVEELIAEIWAHVLQVPAIGRRANFFELGGHSLLATQVIARVRRAFGLDVPLRALFEAPTVAGFATQIAQLQERDSAPPPPLEAGARPARVPLSFAQERLWVLDQWQPGSVAYNVPLAVRLTGRLDLSAVRASLDAIVSRHEVLRTTFPSVDGVPVQAIAAAAPLPMRVVDLSGLEAPEAVARVEAGLEVRRPFDLARGPLLRVVVLRLGPETHVLLLTLHHIVSDGWSVGVLVREFTALYAASTQHSPATLSPLPVQYADYAVWQRQWLHGPVLDEQLQYWARQLADVPALALRSDRPRPAMPRQRGASLSVTVSSELTARLRAFSRAQGVTLFMTLLAAFEVVLYRHSRQEQFTLGVPLANRDRIEIEHLIGFFVNMWPARADLRGNPSWLDLLGRVRAIFLDVSRCQSLPFERLGPALHPRRAADRRSLFDVTFAVEHEMPQLPALADLGVSRFPTGTGTARFDVALWIRQSPDHLTADWGYDRDLFTNDTIVRMADEYGLLLHSLVDTPDATLTAIDHAVQQRAADTAAARSTSRPKGRGARPSVRVS